MFNKESVLALIPARMGSKRLVGKSLLPLLGKPLIAWSIEAGIKSEYIDQVVVSSENEEIRNTARQYGVDIVIDRPANLSTDEATTASVVEHAINSLESIGKSFDWVVLLQPTSPLRTYQHIDDAFELIERKKANGTVSVCRANHPAEWSGQLSTNGFMDSFFRKTKLNLPSHKLQPTYIVNGAIYIVPTARFLASRTFFLATGVAAYVMEREFSIDIDDALDLKLAAFLMRN